ncbi:hypothetical protein BH20VER2_BH20VER2_08860 [soil metagenome]
MKIPAALACILLGAATAQAQVQLELKFARLHYIAYEPVIATVKITNLAGRDIELRNERQQHWFGFEINTTEGRILAPAPQDPEPPLVIEAGQTVTRKINLTPRFPVHELGPYHVRANIYFADLDKFFYSQRKVFHVGDARPIWQRTVGVPEGLPGGGGVRTYSLLSNRFPDHTKLYVRVEDKSSAAVYSTFSLGRVIAIDEPQVELDRQNELHVLHCSAPRTWAYSRIGLNGQLLARSTFMETKTRPRLRQAENGGIGVRGGMIETPAAAAAPGAPTAPGAAKLSARPPNIPTDD